MKSKEMNDAIKAIFGVDVNASVDSNECAMCKRPAVNFRDSLSAREFRISGLCQECQDDIWGSGPTGE